MRKIPSVCWCQPYHSSCKVSGKFLPSISSTILTELSEGIYSHEIIAEDGNSSCNRVKNNETVLVSCISLPAQKVLMQTSNLIFSKMSRDSPVSSDSDSNSISDTEILSDYEELSLRERNSAYEQLRVKHLLLDYRLYDTLFQHEKSELKNLVNSYLDSTVFIERYWSKFTLDETMAVCYYLCERKISKTREQKLTRARIAIYLDVPSNRILELAKKVFRKFVFESARVTFEDLKTRTENVVYRISTHTFNLMEEEDKNNCDCSNLLNYVFRDEIKLIPDR